MDQDLQRYINDHLAGSNGALVLIDDLIKRQQRDTERDFFSDLKEKIEADQQTLKDLLARAGLEESGLLQVTGQLTGKVGRIKLLWEGLEPGKLGMFEALEMLALGIQGKRLLWLVLGEIASHFPEWSGVHFANLELEAITQRDEVEKRRLIAGREALSRSQRLAS